MRKDKEFKDSIEDVVLCEVYHSLLGMEDWGHPGRVLESEITLNPF